MKNYNTFDEYQWEYFFREEEKNVRNYISLLPKYIHLPGEDIILNSHNVEQNNAQCEYYDDEDENTEDVFREENVQAPVIKKIIELSRSWLLIQNAALSDEEKILGLQISAFLAIASGRLLAILDAVAEDNPGFAIAHCKHVRIELSRCEELMRKISSSAPHLKKIISEKISALAEISELVSDKIFDLRKKKANQG